MGVEVRPFGVRRNIACQYCYQNPERDAGNVLASYDLDKMRAAVEREGRAFTLFGGEPLLMPLGDLEKLWAWGLERFGHNSVQTNGVLIGDEHLRLFREYKVHVGLSIDGPGALNDVRWAGSLEKTREATAKTERAIERLCAEGLRLSLIITLHRGNATADKLPAMHAWLRRLRTSGVRSARLHVLEIEEPQIRDKYALSSEENLVALRSFRKLEQELEGFSFDLFDEMRRFLLGEDKNTTCIWNACDPYTTKAVQGIEGNGQSSNCGRTNKDGIDFVKSGVEGFERYLALYNTPQEHGGCKDCRFFMMCKGQCPGTAIDGDWRNRTEHCEVWMELYGEIEQELLAEGKQPLSRDPSRRELEQGFLRQWMSGRNTNLANLLARRQGAAPTAAPSPRGPADPTPDASPA